MDRRALLVLALMALVVATGAWITRGLDTEGAGPVFAADSGAALTSGGSAPRPGPVELSGEAAALPPPEVPDPPADRAPSGSRTSLGSTSVRSARVAVRVTGPDGAPVGGAAVTAYLEVPAEGESRSTRSAGGPVGSLYLVPRTDAQGRAELELPPGRRLRVSVQGSLVGARARSLSLGRLQPGELRELAVELAAGRTVPYHGRVVDASSGGPVPGVGLWRHATGERASEEPGQWDTARPADDGASPAGTFVVQRALWTTDALLVEAPGFVPTTLLLDHAHGEPEGARTVLLHPGSSLEVRLHDDQGRPAEGVELAAVVALRHLAQSEAEALHGRSFRWDATTDAEGVARLTGLPAGVRVQLEARHGDHPEGLPRELTLLPAEQRLLEGTVPAGTRLVLDLRGPDGEAVTEVPELWLVPADRRGGVLLAARHEPRLEQRLAAGAEPVLAGVPAGTWWVGPAPGGVHAPAGRWFELDDAPRTLDLALVLEPARALDGVVLDGDGVPIPDVTVAVRPWSAGEALRCESGEDGRFVLGGLPSGLYEVRALADGDAGHAGSAARSVRVGEADGADPEALPLELVLRAGGCLRGVAMDDGGRLSERFRQVLWTDSEGRVRARTGELADLELAALDERVLDLCAVTEDGRVGVLRGLRAAPGEPPVEFVLELGPGADLRILAPTAEEASFRVFAEGTCVAAGHVRGGQAERVRVPAGDLRVVFPELGLEGPARAEAGAVVDWDAGR